MSDFASRRMMMVDTQVRPSDVTAFPVIDAMLNTPREVYVPDEMRDVAYAGEDVPLAPGRVVLEPRTIAKLLNALDVGPSDLVLLVGCGLGYSAALLARLAEAVVAVEEDPDMAREAEAILGTQGVDNVAVIEAPLTAGSARHGPYDAIVIEGGVEEVPVALTDQLKEGGRIAAIFMDGPLGEVRIGHKHDGHVIWRMEFNAGAPVLPGFAREKSFVF